MQNFKKIKFVLRVMTYNTCVGNEVFINTKDVYLQKILVHQGQLI